MVHDAARRGYQQRAAVYASARPTYHPKLVSRFLENYSRGVVAELGAGTGIFTSQLVAGGCEPIAIEPVKAMRDMVAATHPKLTVVDGTAEHTGLDDHSVDTVIAAQSFHWFDYHAALSEIVRILRPDGFLVCVWNVRDESVDWVRRYTEVVDEFAGDTPRHRTMQWRAAIEDDGEFQPVDDWTIPNPVPATPQEVVDRALSTSFIAALDSARQDDVLRRISDLVSPLGSTFEFPYRSEIQAWRKRPSLASRQG